MYLKKNQWPIPLRMVQMFQYAPSATTSVSERKLAELYAKAIITNDDIEIVKFLYKFAMATPTQIMKALHLENEELLKQRMSKLIQYRVLNRFIFVDGVEITLPAEAFVVYTIDAGGALLLRHFSMEEDCDNWRIDEILMSSIKVSKRLLVVDFYLRLSEECPTRLKSFQIEPVLTVNKTKIIPRFTFCLEVEGIKKYFIGDVAIEEELITPDGNKMLNKISRFETLLTTNGWMKYFEDESEPILIMISDVDNASLRMAKVISATEIKQCRYTTETRFKKPLGRMGAFLKFEEDKLKEVKATIFSEFGDLAPEKKAVKPKEVKEPKEPKAEEAK